MPDRYLLDKKYKPEGIKINPETDYVPMHVDKVSRRVDGGIDLDLIEIPPFLRNEIDSKTDSFQRREAYASIKKVVKKRVEKLSLSSENSRRLFIYLEIPEKFPLKIETQTVTACVTEKGLIGIVLKEFFLN